MELCLRLHTLMFVLFVTTPPQGKARLVFNFDYFSQTKELRSVWTFCGFFLTQPDPLWGAEDLCSLFKVIHSLV